jgi:hypothetical protein
MNSRTFIPRTVIPQKINAFSPTLSALLLISPVSFLLPFYVNPNDNDDKQPAAQVVVDARYEGIWAFWGERTWLWREAYSGLVSWPFCIPHSQ